MRKILILTAILILAASTSFAAATGDVDVSASSTVTGKALHGDHTTAAADTALIGKTSTGVSVAWNTTASGYALMTQHKSGTKAYGSSYDSTALYQTMTDVTPGTEAYNGGTLGATDTTDFVDTAVWKAM